MDNRHEKGFTLIELLVVISILGLLFSIVIVSLSATRQKSRDTQRLASLKQLQNALELYRSDHGSYPPCTDQVSQGGGPQDGFMNQLCGDSQEGDQGSQQFIATLAPYLLPHYIPAIPVDPLDIAFLSYEYATGNTAIQGGYFTCDGESISDFGYVITFRTESSNYTLPKFGIYGVPLAGRGLARNEYCLTSPK